MAMSPKGFLVVAVVALAALALLPTADGKETQAPRRACGRPLPRPARRRKRERGGEGD